MMSVVLMTFVYWHRDEVMWKLLEKLETEAAKVRLI